jgi:hypothetical protein
MNVRVESRLTLLGILRRPSYAAIYFLFVFFGGFGILMLFVDSKEGRLGSLGQRRNGCSAVVRPGTVRYTSGRLGESVSLAQGPLPCLRS